MADFQIEPLDGSHERGAFCCGKAPLDLFLQTQATQHAKTGMNRTFVAVRPGSKLVLGFYAVSAGAFLLNSLPPEKRKRLPKHPVPTLHLGRLAVDQSVQGQGLGRLLLFHFLMKSLNISHEIGVHAVDVWVMDDDARTFYLKYGFVELSDNPFHLYLPISTIKQLFPAG